MEFRVLGQTELRVSRLSMGTMTFGSQVSEEDAVRMVDRCLEAGINFFDTANVYNRGVAETITGKALKGRRHNLVLATKVRGKMGDEPDDEGLSRCAIRKAIEDSLKRLQTDYVDLFYLHQPDWNTHVEETLRAVDELVQDGKVRYVATSNYAAWQIAQMFSIAESKGYSAPSVSQPMYNLLARGIEQEYLAFCREYKVANVIYNPLAGGLLTGKHLEQGKPTAGTRFDGNKMYQDRYWHPDYFQAVEDLSAVADGAGLSLVALAFRWLMSQPAVDSVILGATQLEQLDENFKSCEGSNLTADVLKRCDDIWDTLRGVTPKYNR